MGTRDPRHDAYIAQAPAFAKPILEHLRAVVHAGCPDVVETMKWSAPFFDHHGPLCHVAAFKAHCGFGFWKGALVVGADVWGDGSGPWRHLTSVRDLPPKRALAGWVKKAAALNEAGETVARVAKPKPALDTPADLLAALQNHRAARATFEAFSPSTRREYVEWIVGAKTDATRARRLATAVEWIAEGKKRHWKYGPA